MSEDVFRRILSFPDIGYWRYTEGGEFIFSGGLMRILHLEKKNPVSRESFCKKLYPKDCECFLSVLGKAFSEEESIIHYEARVLANNQHRWLRFYGERESGKNAFFGFAQDIDQYLRNYKDMYDTLKLVRYLSLDQNSGLEKIQKLLSTYD